MSEYTARPKIYKTKASVLQNEQFPLPSRWNILQNYPNALPQLCGVACKQALFWDLANKRECGGPPNRGKKLRRHNLILWVKPQYIFDTFTNFVTLSFCLLSAPGVCKQDTLLASVDLWNEPRVTCVYNDVEYEWSLSLRDSGPGETENRLLRRDTT